MNRKGLERKLNRTLDNLEEEVKAGAHVDWRRSCTSFARDIRVCQRIRQAPGERPMKLEDWIGLGLCAGSLLWLAWLWGLL